MDMQRGWRIEEDGTGGLGFQGFCQSLKFHKEKNVVKQGIQSLWTAYPSGRPFPANHSPAGEVAVAQEVEGADW